MRMGAPRPPPARARALAITPAGPRLPASSAGPMSAVMVAARRLAPPPSAAPSSKAGRRPPPEAKTPAGSRLPRGVGRADVCSVGRCPPKSANAQDSKRPGGTKPAAQSPPTAGPPAAATHAHTTPPRRRATTPPLGPHARRARAPRSPRRRARARPAAAPPPTASRDDVLHRTRPSFRRRRAVLHRERQCALRGSSPRPAAPPLRSGAVPRGHARPHRWRGHASPPPLRRSPAAHRSGPAPRRRPLPRKPHGTSRAASKHPAGRPARAPACGRHGATALDRSHYRSYRAPPAPGDPQLRTAARWRHKHPDDRWGPVEGTRHEKSKRRGEPWWPGYRGGGPPERAQARATRVVRARNAFMRTISSGTRATFLRVRSVA